MLSVSNRFSVPVDNFDTQVIRSMQQFENLREGWEDLFNSCSDLSVFQTFSWNFVWWKHYGQGKQLSIITVRENDILVGIAPFMVNIRFGIEEVEPIGGEHHYNFNLIMDSSRDDVTTAMALKISEIFPKNLVHIPYCAAGTFSIDVLMAALNACGWTVSRWTRNISHYIYEGKGFNGYISGKSKKSRYNLKRERSRLDEPGLVSLKHFCHDDLTEKSVERIAKIQQQSWLARRGQESLSSKFYKEVIPALAKNNHAEIFLYEQNGEDIAYILNLYSGQTCYCFFIGFNESKSHLSPGKMLMLDTLQKVLDRGTTVYDYLYGEGEYKRFWANRTKFICRTVIYMGFRGWLLSWFPHRLHGIFSKYKTLKIMLVKMRRFKMKISHQLKSDH